MRSYILRAIIIQLSLLFSFSNYVRLRQNYKFLLILGDLRYIYQCALCQLRSKTKKRAMISRCKCFEYVVRRKFSWKTVCWNVKNVGFIYFTSLIIRLSNELLWSLNKLKQGLWCTIWLSYTNMYIYIYTYIIICILYYSYIHINSRTMFWFFLAYLVVFCSILDPSCGTLGGVICITKPDTKQNCSQ